jgi:hypothetical protein
MTQTTVQTFHCSIRRPPTSSSRRRRFCGATTAWTVVGGARRRSPAHVRRTFAVVTLHNAEERWPSGEFVSQDGLGWGGRNGHEWLTECCHHDADRST